jgi:hypothetical protein
MKQLLLIALILGLTNCTINQSKLSGNKTFRKTFTESEIQDLQLLFDFFNESICSETNTEDFSVCYKEFFKKLEKSEETGEIHLDIPFDKQMKVYDSFSDSTFNEIWTLGKSWNDGDAPQDLYSPVHFTPNGKYLKFLKSTGKDDNVIKHYYESIIATGDISPSIISGLLVNYDHYNIKDIRVRFIVAVHYLSLNDRSERREKND